MHEDFSDVIDKVRPAPVATMARVRLILAAAMFEVLLYSNRYVPFQKKKSLLILFVLPTYA